MALISVERLSKRYRMGEVEVDALKDVSLAIEAGESVAIMGQSGSGKTTLMNLLGCLDLPTSGRYMLDGQDVARLSRTALAQFRNRHVGFIFQSFNLLSRATALENVELPLVYGGMGTRQRRQRALEMLEAVGLADRVHHLPSQLSGGQQQRVAIARALANSPQLILADEPTGSLDSQTSRLVMDALRLVNSRGLTVVLITHDAKLAQEMKRIITLSDGKVVGDSAEPLRGAAKARLPESVPA
jgi:putative ABC transport system ATP-binding protein